MKQLLLILSLVLATGTARAGFIELGVSGNYKRANIDENAYDESRSMTGSMSYYFDEMTALELSYTDGRSKRFIGTTTGQDHTTTMTYSMMGLDFVLTLGERDAVLRPYFKLGVAYILRKRLVDEFQGFPPDVREDEPTTVPSAGAGFRLLLSKNMSLKFGIEAWTARSVDKRPVDIDYAGRAGLSWMF